MLEKMMAPAPKRVVHKFSPYQEVIKLGLPARFLSAAMQGDQPQFWVQHCPDSEVQVNTEIRVYGTGQTIDDGFEFLGTYFENSFVWHIYAKAEKSS